MAIINLGSPGSPRPSPLSGLSDALSTGMKIGETRRSNRANEALQGEQNKIQSTNTALRSDEAGMEKSRLSAQLAKQTFDEAQVNRTNTMKAVENLSMYMNGKSKQEQEMFKTTDHYKEVSKLVKTYAPEFYDKDKQEIVTLTLGTMAEDKLKANVSKIQQKVLDGQQITPEEQQYMDVVDKVGPKMIASAMEAVSLNPNIDMNNPKEVSTAMQNTIRSMMGGKNALQESYQTLNNPLSNPLGLDIMK